MAVYDERILKGQELEYYTRKLKAKLNEIEEEIAGDKEELLDAIDALDDKLDSEVERLEKLKLQLQLVDHEVTEPCYVYNKVTYPTEQAAKDAADADVTGPDSEGKWHWNDNEYETEAEAKAAAEGSIREGERVIELVMADGTIIKHNADPSADPPEIEPSHQFIYLVPGNSGDPATDTIQPNYCNEYIWNDDRLEFELIGSTDVDLDELTDSDIDNIWDTVFN